MADPVDIALNAYRVGKALGFDVAKPIMSGVVEPLQHALERQFESSSSKNARRLARKDNNAKMRELKRMEDERLAKHTAEKRASGETIYGGFTGNIGGGRVDKSMKQQGSNNKPF